VNCSGFPLVLSHIRHSFVYLPFQTEALNKLSLMHKLVISTGGGAVVRPINWYKN
jgi:hypothetical protein